jgi:hypothetical protein
LAVTYAPRAMPSEGAEAATAKNRGARGGSGSANCATHPREPTSNDDAATDRKSGAGARTAE